ncbi:MAG: hypothetical protein HZA92_18855 [Verrucomicrobia bacterium]|nr:hypothetical protein [Verrucomicrobiota bacterium]
MNWPQLQTILWLRLRLARNQFFRGSGLGAVVATVFLAAAVVSGLALFVGGLLVGKFALVGVSSLHLMLVWVGLTVGFIFFWSLGLLTELQRSETIDLQRLMHLPVLLGQLFFINYLASHAAVSVILAVPAMLGLTFGLVLSHGPAMLLLAPLALSMVFMVTAWTYCLRGWLAALMSNPRRRRNVVMGITLGFILIFQLPNLYFNVIARGNRDVAQPAASPEEAQRQRETRRVVDRSRLEQALAVQPFLPPFWVSVGAQALAEGRFGPALLGTLGCLGLGALGLRRAYRSTVRFYRGETGGQAPVASTAPTTATASAPDQFLERILPGVPEQAAAVALATFRSLLRAPEVRMNLATSFIVMVIMMGSMFMRRSLKLPPAAEPFIVTGMAALAVFMVFQFLGNQFGFDRAGFRALVLSPADRRLILLGKNLAHLPLAAVFGLLLISVATIYFSLSLAVFGAALLQFAAALSLGFTAGNLLSIMVPYRIQPGTMKPTKMPTVAMLAMIFAQLLLPLALAPAFLPPAAALYWANGDWPAWMPDAVNLLLSSLLAGAAAALYWHTLAPFARLLQKRETKILDLLSVEVE